MTAIVCWNCGGSLDDIPRPISRHAQCSHCFNELHCCRLCKHYDAERTTTCHEDRADPPLQKENANFCDFFRPQPGAFERKTADKSDSARGELDALFGQDSASEVEPEDDAAPEAPTKEEEARKKLDDLFN